MCGGARARCVAAAALSIALTSCAQCVEATLGTQHFQQQKIGQWTSNVVEQCLKRLTALGKPFKYVGVFEGAFVVPVAVLARWH